MGLFLKLGLRTIYWVVKLDFVMSTVALPFSLERYCIFENLVLVPVVAPTFLLRDNQMPFWTTIQWDNKGWEPVIFTMSVTWNVKVNLTIDDRNSFAQKNNNDKKKDRNRQCIACMIRYIMLVPSLYRDMHIRHIMNKKYIEYGTSN